MIRWRRLAAAIAFGAGLTAAGAAPAQTPNDSAAPAADSAHPAPPPAQSTTPSSEPSDQDASQPVYSVKPPEGSSGVDLPEAVGGYARSVAGCVLIGCDDGPQVDGASAPPPSNSDEPPAELQPPAPR